MAGGGRKVWRPVEASRGRPCSSVSQTATERYITEMDRDSLTLQINNMRFQAKMERWPLSKSIEA